MIDWESYPEATHWTPEDEYNKECFWKIRNDIALECWVVGQDVEFIDHFIFPYLTEHNRETLVKKGSE